MNGYAPPLGGALGRFVGSGFDGADSELATALPNPLSGDSDLDGVPDWWESRNYLSLTIADAATDLDGDGRGSLNEYLADTDPNDPLSLLAIISLFHTTGTLTVTCATTSPNRRYWLETSTDLTAGGWSTASQTPLAGTLATAYSA